MSGINTSLSLGAIRSLGSTSLSAQQWSCASNRCLRRGIATNTSDVPAPPLLLKLKSELKTAMRNKDSNKLNVLRGILAETTNAAKTSNPVRTDMQLLSLLRKRAEASRAAALEFATGNRADLQEKEMGQVSVLEEYAGSVETLNDDDITSVIQEVVSNMRSDGNTVNIGTVLKQVLGPGGPLAEKPVDKSQVAKLAKGMI